MFTLFGNLLHLWDPFFLGCGMGRGSVALLPENFLERHTLHLWKYSCSAPTKRPNWVSAPFLQNLISWNKRRASARVAIILHHRQTHRFQIKLASCYLAGEPENLTTFLFGGKKSRNYYRPAGRWNDQNEIENGMGKRSVSCFLFNLFIRYCWSYTGIVPNHSARSPTSN